MRSELPLTLNSSELQRLADVAGHEEFLRMQHRVAEVGIELASARDLSITGLSSSKYFRNDLSRFGVVVVRQEEKTEVERFLPVIRLQEFYARVSPVYGMRGRTMVAQVSMNGYTGEIPGHIWQGGQLIVTNGEALMEQHLFGDSHRGKLAPFPLDPKSREANIVTLSTRRLPR